MRYDTERRNTLGVVIGRFQVDELHEGHRMLISEVREKHNRLLILVGTGPLPTTSRKPLPFATRKAIIQDHYPEAEVLEIHDHPSDWLWSVSVDRAIKSVLTPETYKARLYHSRDSFKEFYEGEYPLTEIEEADLGVSGTLRRKLIAREPGHTAEFARGVIWANSNKFPTVYSVVDMAVFADNLSKLLVITKDHHSGLMLPGGFCDVGSPSDEHDASREIEEETGLIIEEDAWSYVGSRKITDDWRYMHEEDEMRTRLFTARYMGQWEPVAGDDAATAEFVDLKTISREDFHPNHQPLFDMLNASDLPTLRVAMS